MLIVTGMHRGGTTIVGQLLQSSRLFSYIHEPFNLDYGAVGVPCWYPQMSDIDPKLAKVLDSLRTVSFKCKRPDVRGRPIVRQLLGLLVKSRTQVDLCRHLLSAPRKEVLYKDPSLARCIPYLIDKYGDIKVIFIVRHPVAIYDSILRMGWSLQEVSGLAGLPLHAAVAALWRSICEVAQQAELSSKNVMLVRHEDLCMEPMATSERLFQFIGRRMPGGARHFVARHMFGDVVRPGDDTLHVTYRDAAALASAWKSAPKPEHRFIVDECEPLLSRWYPAEIPKCDVDE